MPQTYQICLFQPEDYIHTGAFYEIAELLQYGLRALGYEAETRINDIDPNARNILIGVHLLDHRAAAHMPANSIVLNTEQLGGIASGWNRNILKWCSDDFTLWDYSDANVKYLKASGVERAAKLELGYQGELNRIQPRDHKDVDILFYGCINERRQKILNALEAYGLRVKALYGVFGAERDEWIARSKLVLNLHYYESQIFEIVRVFYLMTNGIPTAAEVNAETKIDNFYKKGLLCCPYEGFVDGVMELLEDKARLARLGTLGRETIMERPQTELLQNIL